MLQRSSRAILAVLLCSFVLRGADADPAQNLVEKLGPLLDTINGKAEKFCLKAAFDVAGQKGSVEVGARNARTFWLKLDAGKDIQGTISVTPEETWLYIPSKELVFKGAGALPENAEKIDPVKIALAAANLQASTQVAWNALRGEQREVLAPMINLAAFVEEKPASKAFEFRKEKEGPVLGAIKFGETGFEIEISSKNGDNIHIKRADEIEPPVFTRLPQGVNVVEVPRAELERALHRGAARAIGILGEDQLAVPPIDNVVEIPGARLEIKDGQRVCWLTGSPAEMGREHGKLFAREIRKVMDSTLYVVGFAYSVGKGKWFLDDLRGAWKRLEPHCDKEYLEELDGLAEGSGIPRDEVRIAAVFPELFHCSGFAVAKDATVGGKLFHGRVLDYMTQIGLQHVQVDFVTKSPGKHATINVGYAGFVGCVTGMNDAQISMGEMGGRGEGNWDGTPMAFLMRRVLERSGTLEDARKIMTDAKRTCEYYYVIADGKSREAYGVAAWPEKIEFLKQGETHPLLPSSVPGCVLLSGGDRYTLLAQRAKEGFGKLDEQGALDLMKRPVAMSSCLHAVLFIPEDQTYYAAHASLRGHKPASEQKYVKHNFKEQVEMLSKVEEKKVSAAEK